MAGAVALHGPAHAAPLRATAARCGCRSRAPARRSVAVLAVDPKYKMVEAFAPATVANLGPGYDWLGCAVQGQGDFVTARVVPDKPGELFIEAIEGDGGRLSKDVDANCAGIAARECLKLMGGASCGVALTVKKGMPLGSGLGSSAASAAAGAQAVNALFGDPLTRDQLVYAGLQSEATVSGYHADNIAPAVWGGFVLVRSADPLELVELPYGSQELCFVLVNPKYECPTAEMRAALGDTVPQKDWIANSSAGGMLVAGILKGDAMMIGEALDSDVVVEPVRGNFIPGFFAVKKAAKAAGAYGCTISGAGPTCVAVVPNEQVAEEVRDAMCAAFVNEGGLEVNIALITKLDSEGAVTRVAS
ncbi:unnamed protein product [Pedinophyceae sp. YPF-701]|nr:unnamed protein product [Pedinophyceae sp. YPF-701]